MIGIENRKSEISNSTGRFFVKWRGHAVEFHSGLCRKVYSLVSEEEATGFRSQADAARFARDHNLRATEIEIVERED